MEAFQQAGPFPNPPKGMLDADGFVRIRWDFILKAEAAPRINFGSAGSGSRPMPESRCVRFLYGKFQSSSRPAKRIEFEVPIYFREEEGSRK